jgi:mannose-6-phosphate isomerase
MSYTLYPLLLEPAMHVKVWGGDRLHTLLNKPKPTDEPYGESWEMHDTAVVLNGELAGQTVRDVLKAWGQDLCGLDYKPRDGMPLLVKFLDAHDWLSVQVHPNDVQAAQLEGEPRGKTEAWYVVAAEPNSKLVIGVTPGTEKDVLANAVRENTLEDLLVYANVTAGDVLFVAAGTIHALGPGLLIYEIQQSSDTTYRFYDWGRLDLNGSPRPLHIEKSLAVSNLDTLPDIQHTAGSDNAVVEIVSSEYFQTVLHQMGAGKPTQVGLYTFGSFHTLTCIDGSLTVTANEVAITLNKGQTALLPAALGEYVMKTGDTARVLRSW